jgi:hypothetical protein
MEGAHSEYFRKFVLAGNSASDLFRILQSHWLVIACQMAASWSVELQAEDRRKFGCPAREAVYPFLDQRTQAP